MSSVHFEGDNNRGAGRDYYEHYERHEHYYSGSAPPGDDQPPRRQASGGGVPPADLSSVDALRKQLAIALKRKRRNQIRNIFNPIYLLMTALFVSAVLTAGVAILNLGALFRGDQAWGLYVPATLFATMFLVQLIGKQKLEMLSYQVEASEKEVRKLMMEIAERQSQ